MEAMKLSEFLFALHQFPDKRLQRRQGGRVILKKRWLLLGVIPLRSKGLSELVSRWRGTGLFLMSQRRWGEKFRRAGEASL